MSFILQLLCCCGRSRSDSLSEPDERSRLIPTTEDTSPAQRHVVVDHQRMKERLGVIVRSKESKMVNVNAALPFNLHNKALHGRVDQSHSPQRSVDTARSSSSVSAAQPDEEEVRRPVLGVRIIRRTGSSNLGSARRGRTSARGARGGASAAKSYADAARDETLGDVQRADEEGRSAGAPSPGESSKISDVGSLTRSWGD